MSSIILVANKEAALAFCQNKRAILPKAYSEHKMKKAQEHNSKLTLNQDDTDDADEVDEFMKRFTRS